MAPNQKGHRILKVLHWLFAVVTVVYLAMGIYGVITMWNMQPNLVGCMTLVVALIFTTLGLFWILSWLASWTLGWFECGTIQAGIWKDIRNEIASVVSFLVGVSCITGAITWILER
jgi:hypothetical protein